MSRSQKQLDLARRRGRAGAEAAARSPKKSWPLRKVVGDEWIKHEGVAGSFRRELLECGHLIAPARDFIGETSPARRRCGECARGQG